MSRIEAAQLYVHAVRVAQPRQLRARATRPLRRRKFESGPAPRPPRPLGAAETLWRSDAFARPAAPEPGTRLADFHAQYGDDVLEAARAGDEALAQRLVLAWIASTPPRADADAWHPYPLSTRVGNWLAAGTLAPGIVDSAFADSAWRQLVRLTANVEDDILGNHVIRNARALVLGGVAFEAERLTRQGLALLRREVPEQILADGGHYERSPSYHLVVLRDLLEVQAVAPQPWLAEPIERMRRFAAALQRPDGAPALFNDGTVDAPRLDLPAPPDGLAVFEESGFAVVRDGPLWLAFRCGVAAPQFLPAHAHADALSLQCCWDGRPVLVDPGTSTYEAGDVRSGERGTGTHSTVRVDGVDQFALWGAFRSGRLPHVTLLGARPGELEAAVDLPNGIRHTRRVTWAGRELVVHDALAGRGRHSIESRLCWAPGLELPDLDPPSGATVANEHAFVAERFGERQAARASVARVEQMLPAELRWRLRLS